MKDNLVKQLPSELTPSSHFGRQTMPDKGYYAQSPSTARDTLLSFSGRNKPLCISDIIAGDVKQPFRVLHKKSDGESDVMSPRGFAEIRGKLATAAIQ
eukprot:11367488-Karenia_brevis.AAC.1